MMGGSELPVVMECASSRMIGVLHPASKTAQRGVLIVVGGPQYRVGSHRQFLQLARHMAASGIPVFRFDYRGMGDSEGRQRTFEEIDQDISVALDEFCRQLPTVKEVVIWGLCDAASAALMFAASDSRVSGLVLLNPWLRSESTLAKTYLRHYYLSRSLDPEFWKRLVSGKVNPLSVISGYLATLKSAFGAGAKAPRQPGPDLPHARGEGRANFTDRMREGFSNFDGPVLIILSGDDLTAAEFSDEVSGSKGWKNVLGRANVTCVEIAGANHTFSRRIWRDEVESTTAEWVRSW